MFYTPGQLRQSVGLSKEAFRHWRRVVPGLANERGHAPSFSPGDVLASAVLKTLTETAGVRIGHLSEVAPAIFRVCNNSDWETLRGQRLIIDLQGSSCVAESDPVRPKGNLIVICALEPVIRLLQSDLLGSDGQNRPDVALAKSPRASVQARGVQ